MRIFLTGASGYIGGSIATALIAAGHTVAGLCRSKEKSVLLEQTGIQPVIGALSDEKVLSQAAQAADAVVNAADADDPFALVSSLKISLDRSGLIKLEGWPSILRSLRALHEESILLLYVLA